MMVKLITLSVSIVFSVLFCQQNDPELAESKKRGKLIYEEFCVTCHRADGSGFGKLYPPLAKSDFLLNNREASIRAVKYGLQGEITVNGQKYNKKMDPLGLSDEEVTDVMNYILYSWGNTTVKKVTLHEVEAVSKT